MKSQKNLGTVDRLVRIVAGVILLLLVPLAYVGPGSEWVFFGLLGVFPLVAGIAGYCPPYALLGINTYQGRKEQIQKPVEDGPETACC